jgi:hypothetical protein
MPMTESRWLASKSVNVLRKWWMKQPNRNLRKERLFACACCRRLWCQLPDERSRAAVEAAEQYADRLILKKELAAARQAALCAREDVGPPDSIPWRPEDAAECAASTTHKDDVLEATTCRVRSARVRLRLSTFTKEEAEQVLLFRDIFGNPFRPVAFDPAWRTVDAVSMAQHMYDTRDFSAMPILADALQDAGCDSDDVLTHCRGPGPHVRGCWVVDLVLGKE